MTIIETPKPTIESHGELPTARPVEAYIGTRAVAPVIELESSSDAVARALVERFRTTQQSPAESISPVQTRPFSEIRGTRLQQLNRR